MSHERQDGPALGRRGKIVAGVVVAAVAVFMILEWTVLRGEQVATLSVGLGGSDVEKVILDRVGEEYLFEIDTSERRGGKTEGRAVKIRLTDPEGNVAYESSGAVAKKEHFFSFTPTTPGSYELTVRPGRMLGGSSSGLAHVRVFVGDRRVLARLTAAAPF